MTGQFKKVWAALRHISVTIHVLNRKDSIMTSACDSVHLVAQSSQLLVWAHTKY